VSALECGDLSPLLFAPMMPSSKKSADKSAHSKLKLKLRPHTHTPIALGRARAKGELA